MASSVIHSTHPPEIILCIADHLPISSASCLALSNRSLKNLLGPSAWEALKTQPREEKIEFLSLLSRDLPHHFVCLHNCMKLHLSSGVIWPNKPNQYALGHDCALSSGSFIARHDSPYMITVEHIQLAMKRHNYGAPHGIPLEAFTYTEVEQLPYCIITELLSVECRIVSGELLLRSQHWVQVPTDHRQEIISHDIYPFLCEHIGAWDYQDQTSQEILSCTITHPINDGVLHSCRSMFECHSCRMEFQINLMDLGSGNTAVYITRWANLGSGTTPLLSDFGPDSNGFLGATVGHFDPGSIRDAFEAQDGLSLRDFTEQNKNRLLLERQRGSRTRFGWTRDSSETQWYFQNLGEREAPKSIIASVMRWISDWWYDVF